MTKHAVTLSIDKNIHNDFTDYCNKHGMRISKRIEILMERELRNPTFKE